MIQFLKVIDIAVKLENLDKATKTWEDLLQVEHIPMKEEYNPDGGVRANHLPLPAGELACHAIGLMAPKDDGSEGGQVLRQHLERYGESVYLLGFMVEDVYKTQQELMKKGFEFRSPEPTRYAAGIHNITKPHDGLQGLSIQIACHDQGALDRWRDGQ
ncbi:MAG: hypothetical protein CME59_01535 [Halioglobus sp.]|nr:hypothetical protein [Halioglobus sp.]|tara:strand:+ start:1759 stop:2232 length:474 start_codon:yes stop_codon:yes gene_type:complete